MADTKSSASSQATSIFSRPTILIPIRADRTGPTAATCKTRFPEEPSISIPVAINKPATFLPILLLFFIPSRTRLPASIAGRRAKRFAHEKGLDHALAIMKEGYTLASSRCRHYGCDAFQTRIMMQKAVCAMTLDIEPMFYTPGHFTCKLALPPTILFLLQDEASVMH